MKRFFKMSMVNQIMIAMILGIIFGLIFKERVESIKFIGDIFLRLIQMSVVLLIMGAVIEAVGQLDPRDLGKLGIKLFAWFIFSTLFAGFIGLVIGNIFKPGTGLPKMDLDLVDTIEKNQQSTQELLVSFFPKNIIEAMSNGEMIQVIVFALLFGVSLSILNKDGKKIHILAFFKSMNIIFIQMVKLVMYLAPIGIFSLISWVTGKIGFQIIIPLIKFLGCMALGTIIIFITMLLISATRAKVNPFTLARKLSRMTLIAFTTTSSAISLPIKMEDSETKLGVSKRISNLVNPLGMALNSNGLSLYLALSVITLSQFFGVEFTFVQQVQVLILATLSCLGTVVVPGGGLVALTIIIPALGLPIEAIGLLAGIDWFSGMFRTVLNVDVDALIALIIAVDEDEFDRDVFDGKKIISEDI